MPNQITAKVESRNLAGALRQLAKIEGKDIAPVVEFETAKILEYALKKTKAASIKSLKANHDSKPYTTFKSSYKTDHKFSGILYKGGSKRYALSFKFPDALWSEIKASRAKDFERKKKARGMLKKVWAQLADDLGMNIDVPGYVDQSTTTSGDHPEDADARRVGGGAKFFIQGINARPYGGRDKFKAINMAMRKRTNSMRTRIKMAIAAKARMISVSFPGLSVK